MRVAIVRAAKSPSLDAAGRTPLFCPLRNMELRCSIRPGERGSGTSVTRPIYGGLSGPIREHPQGADRYSSQCSRRLETTAAPGVTAALRWRDPCSLISAYSMDIGAARYVTTQGSAAIEIQVCVR